METSRSVTQNWLAGQFLLGLRVRESASSLKIHYFGWFSDGPSALVFGFSSGVLQGSQPRVDCRLNLNLLLLSGTAPTTAGAPSRQNTNCLGQNSQRNKTNRRQIRVYKNRFTIKNWLTQCAFCKLGLMGQSQGKQVLNANPTLPWE